MTSLVPLARSASLSRDAETPGERLCLACGRLVDPLPLHGYRERADTVAADPCPGCQRSELVDLGSATTALMLADDLERDRPQRGPLALRLALRLAISSGATLLLVCLVWTVLMLTTFGHGKGYQGATLLGLLILALFGGPGVLLAGRAIGRTWRRTATRRLPARWRLQLPARTSGERLVEAPIRCEAPLVAPISGVACVAFEVGLREDSDGDAVPGTWLLLEQRSAACRVGDTDLPHDGVCLALPRRPIDWPGPGPDRVRAEAFLRARGFVVNETAELRVFEGVITVDEVVTVLATTPPTLVPRGS